MAERRGRAKLPVPAPNKKQANRRAQQQVQGPVVVLPTTKPKPKRKAQNPVRNPAEAEYAELKQVQRESVNHYAPLCAATRDKQPGQGPQDTHPGVPEEVAKPSTADLEMHYSNVHVAIPDSYENCDKKRKPTMLKKFCRSHWTLTLAIVLVTISVVCVALVLVGIASAGLSGSSKNSERYQELQQTTVTMAEQIEALQTQLDGSLFDLRQLRSESRKLTNMFTEFSDSQIHNLSEFEERVRGMFATFSDSQMQRLNEFEERLDQIQENVDSIQRQQQVSLSSNITKLEGSIQQLNRSLLTEISDRITQSHTVDADLEQININLTQLGSSIETVDANVMTVTNAVSQLIAYAVPIDCPSTVYQGLANNSSVAVSPVQPYQVRFLFV